jgi:hypothetical protein
MGLLLAVGGCGSDEERAETSATSPLTTTTETRADETASRPAPETVTKTTETKTGGTPPPSPEEAPGGAGDEEPARSLALFTAEDGRIVPRVVRVPAFISIRVELRSADGRRYGLDIAGETIRVGGGLGSVATTIDGLRPGEAVVGKPVGDGNRVRIEATAEPGP